MINFFKSISVLLLAVNFYSQAQVRYYRQLPDLALSPHYKVSVKQGATAYKEIFTYQIEPNTKPADYPAKHKTKNDQFANFGFNPDGGAVKIRIERVDGVALTEENAQYKNKTYTDVSSSIVDGALEITCPSVKKHLFVEFEGKTEYPLMVFVDPFADTPIPAGAKVHTFVASNKPYVQTAEFDRFSIPNDVDAVVIEDGAMVKGTLHTSSNRTKPLLVTGRGVLIGNGGILHGPENIPFNALVITKGTKHIIENIMVINSRHFSIDIGDECKLDNAKMYGYDFNNDGVVAGDRSIVSNVFSKVNDDHIKLYNDNVEVRNCTFWEQANGGLFQLAWNKITPGSNILVENCEVLSWEANCGDAKVTSGGLARTFINLRSTTALPKVGNYTFRNIYVATQLDRMIGINGKYHGSNSVGIENINFENITFEKLPKRNSWIYTGDAPFKVSFNFKNVKMGGECFDGKIHQIATEGNVDLKYEGCGETNTPPKVKIDFPTKETILRTTNKVNLKVTATDENGSVIKVKAYFNNVLFNNQLKDVPYEWENIASQVNLTALPVGEQQIKVIAYDNKGDSTIATTLVTILPPKRSPFVKITEPILESSYLTNQIVNVKVNALDTGGSIQTVKLYLNDDQIGTSTTAPFQWSDIAKLTPNKAFAVGDYQLKAVAIDNDGDSSTTTSDFEIKSVIASPDPTINEIAIKVYPNPSDGKFYIVTPGDFTFRFTDSNGLLIKKGSARHKYYFSENLRKGFYFLKVVAKKDSLTRKLKIQ
ncbi:MAG: T9SS type A sorting domain-containing protein [Pseudarcicella sp.]|nr:T9SS type A sorting domain-containing protein [Pseudarcicella sp.]